MVAPRSFCPSCHAPVASLDNVPVLSWLVLRGRCRRCRAPISPRYPLVEGTTGAVFAALGWIIGAHWAVVGCCVLAATVLALTAVALDGLAPPVSISLVGATVGTALLVGAAAGDHRWGRLVGSLAGVGIATAAAGALALAVRRRDTIDVRGLAALPPAGALLGWVGPLGAGVGIVTAVTVVGVIAVGWPARRETQHLAGVVTLSVAVGTAAGIAVAAALGRVTGT